MNLRRFRGVLIGLGLLSACGDDTPEGAVMGPPPGSVPPVVIQPLPDAGSSTLAPAPVVTSDGALPLPTLLDAGAPRSDAQVAALDAALPPSDSGDVRADAPQASAQQPYDYMMQEVALSADLVIPRGKTLRVGPGVKFTAKANIKIDVQGTLLVEGSAAAPCSFLGNGQPESWQGIVLASGASLMLDHARVGNAKYGIHALPGSTFAVDHAVFDTSFKGAVLQADGSIAHATFKAELLFPAITEEVAIDDPNGFLTIINASPTVTNSRFDGSGGLNDMVRIGGNASPKFDHCYVNNSHCGFHTSGGSNNSPRISNTIFENLSYGVMAYTSKPIIENSVFRRNGSDIGMCSGATTANTPVLMSNFYEGGAVLLDASCDRIGTRDPSAAAGASPSAGPTGL